MPLIKSNSKSAISTNIKEMQASGHPHAQAIAAALSNARRYGRKYADGGDVDAPDLSDAAQADAARTIAASRVRQAVQPIAGRQESPDANLPGQFIASAAKGMYDQATLPMREPVHVPPDSYTDDSGRILVKKDGQLVPWQEADPQASQAYEQDMLERANWGPRFALNRLSGPLGMKPGAATPGSGAVMPAAKAAEEATPAAEGAAKGWHFTWSSGGHEPEIETFGPHIASKYLYINKGDPKAAIKDITKDYENTNFHAVEDAIGMLQNNPKGLPTAKWIGPNHPYPELEPGWKDLPLEQKLESIIPNSTKPKNIYDSLDAELKSILGPDEAFPLSGKIEDSKFFTNKSQVDQIVDQMKDYMGSPKNPAKKAEKVLSDIADKAAYKYNKIALATADRWAKETAPKFKVPPFIREKAEQIGLNQPAFHGTNATHEIGQGFEEFMLPPRQIGAHFGTQQAAHDIMSWDQPGSRIYPVMIKAKNPLDLPDLGSWYPNKMADALKEHSNIPNHEINAIMNAKYLNSNVTEKQTEALRSLIQKHGYDSIRYTNAVEDPGSVSYIALDPSHIRSMYAKFDPDKKHLAHLAAGLAGAGWVGANALGKQESGMAGGGKVHDRIARKYAAGGSPTAPWFVRQEAKNVFREGMLHSSVPGRTDKLPISVNGGSYIVPADIVSALGQGNSLSGNSIIRKMFNSSPYGLPVPHIRSGRPNIGSLPRAARMANNKPFGFANGGSTEPTPIIAAGGEYVLSPETVLKVGGGDMKHGHAVLDRWVKMVREKHIRTLKHLPGPAKD